MAFEVNFTNGTVAKLVEDGVTDSTYSVKLVGKNVVSYGETFAENFIQLLENHANTVAPTNPVKGQLWFNTSSSTVSGIGATSIGMWNGDTWKTLGVSNITATQPTNPDVGDFWYDTTNDQLKIYSGASFDLIGPAYSEQDGKGGPIVELVTDDSATNHLVTKIYNSDEGDPTSSIVVATISKDAEFTPDPAIVGFSTIKPGIQLSSNVTGIKFHGAATSIDGIGANEFLSATSNDTTTGTIGILNDGGLTIGASQDLTITVSTDDVTIQNETSGGDVVLGVNVSSVQTDVITIDGASGLALVNANPTANLGVATKQYVDTAEADAISTAETYTDTEITGLQSGASTNYNTFAKVEARIGEVSTASTNGLADKVDLAGDTMTGTLILSGAPTADLHAATKKYVDDTANAITPGSSENGYGTRTVSTSAPSGGSDGDIWYRI